MIEIKDEQGKFYEIYQDLFSKIIGETELYGNILYHYTSPEALISILQQGKNGNNRDVDTINFHFTKADSLNDKNEGKEFFKIYEETINQLLKDKKISPEFYDFIHRIEHKNIFWWDESTSLYPYKECETYICSFSKGKDLLPMWNYYSKNSQYEGYNLGIRFEGKEQLSKAFLSLGIKGEINLFKVIYDKSKIKNVLYEFIFQLSKECDLNNDSDKNNIDINVKMASTILKYIVKHNAFTHEEECRFVLNILKGSCENKINYKTKKGILIPYIDIRLQKKFLKEITIGPLIENETAENMLKFFLNQNEYKIRYDNNTYDGVLINKSEIPIRY